MRDSVDRRQFLNTLLGTGVSLTVMGGIAQEVLASDESVLIRSNHPVVDRMLRAAGLQGERESASADDPKYDKYDKYDKYEKYDQYTKYEMYKDYTKFKYGPR